MSHNMEFGFPQSMKTCNTCHADKLTETLATENFTVETCISCHAVDKLIEKMKTNRAGATISVHNVFADPNNDGIVTVAEADLLKSKTCYACHSPAGFINPATSLPYEGAGAGVEFTNIHTGYDPEIYTDAGIKYSEAITVSIDNASFDTATNMLTVEFSASEDIAIDPYNPENIVPTVMVGPYGYDAKQYIVYPHGSDADGKRLLEYDIGSGPHPRFTEVDTGDPTTWEVQVDLSMWADKIADGVIRRLEIGVMPQLAHATITELDRRGNPVSMLVAMNAPSRTFDITALPSGVFLNEYPDVADGVEDDVVNVLGGCNTCHDALATSFHSAQRGGNIKICKMCHVPSAAGSHLEMQSRSIDSYVHAIHSFQEFDIGDIDFSDPLEAAEHDHKLQSEFPRFGIKNCESCHNPGTYGVPDQSRSLPSLHAGNDTLKGDATRNIGEVPLYVMGPAARACGACHRAQMLRADDADKLAAFNDHVRTFGYLVEDDTGVWDAVVEKIMSVFN
jgi:OmcA/MtrC family decaheme c-type cytochrome